MFARLGVAWRLFITKMPERVIHVWHNGLWKMIKILLQLEESLMWIENTLKSGLNKRRVYWIKNVEADQMAEVVLRGFHCWNKHCTVIIKKYGMKGKQSNIDGLIWGQSILVKNFIHMKILKLLINGFRDLPTASKFHFVEKCIVRKKIHKVWVIQSQISIQRSCVPEDVEHTRWKTSQTCIRHHCHLWWTKVKRMLTIGLEAGA